jgi:protein-disulfide isomerase
LPELAQNTTDLSKLLLPIQPEDHVQGDPDARFTLVEYGDYECPDCGRLFNTICELRGRCSHDLRIAFRQYPRSGIHPHAQQAAEAAEAAAAQDRLWEMHDLLFANQNALATKDLLRYAERLELDTKRFSADLKNRVFEERVRLDFRRGVANGVYGTPGLFINGIRYNGSLEADLLVEYLEALP